MGRLIFTILIIGLAAFGSAPESKAQAADPDGYPGNYAKAPRFKAIVFYSTTAEEAHVQFGEQTVDFFKRLNYGDGYYLDIATDFFGYDYEKLKEYNTVVWVNTSPYSKEIGRASCRERV